jgi:hypothetical protein
MKFRHHIAVLTCLISATANANDGAAGLDGGNLVFKNLQGVEMRSEVLTISPEKVSVTYEFFNKTDADISSLVSFPIEIELESDLNFDAKAANPNQFSVTVNGTARSFETKSQKKDGLKTVQHYWTQNFPAKKVTRIQHSYKPIFSSDVMQLMVGGKDSSKEMEKSRDEYYSVFAKEFCLSPGQKQQMRKGRYIFDVLRYVLMTANTWDGPIRNFKLRLEKGDRDHLFLCTDLNLKKTAPGVFEASKRDFRPKSDLRIAYSRKL